MKNSSKFRSVAGKAAVITVIAAVILTLGIVVTYAFLSGKSQDTVKNKLSSDVNPTASISETVSESEKTDVKVTVSADYATYVRAIPVINWIEVDASGEPTGNIYNTVPVQGTDYELTYANIIQPEGTLRPEKWTLGSDGFYYYSSPVAAGGSTEVLISECHTLVGADVPASQSEGCSYKLNVTVVAQTIQAKGTTDAETYEAGKLAVVDAWGVDTTDYTADDVTVILISKGFGDQPNPSGGGFDLPEDPVDG